MGSFAAELLKLRKRPATWVLVAVSVVALALFGYVFTYIFVVGAPEDVAPAPEAAEIFREYLLPENFLINVLSNGFVGFGSALALVLGALAIGSEYGWETFRSALIQKPGRTALFTGKLLAVAAVLLVFTLAMLAAGALSSYAVALLEGASASWPPAGEILRAAGAGWLVLATFCSLGILLATLFRGTALAIGLGLVYLLVLENLFLGLAPQNEFVESIGQALPTRNALDLAASFGELPPGFAGPEEAAEPARAALVLGAYLAGFALLSLLLFRRRDLP